MKVFPKSQFDKKQSRNALYDYLAKKETLDWKDSYSKFLFHQKPWYMIENERQQATKEVDIC